MYLQFLALIIIFAVIFHVLLIRFAPYLNLVDVPNKRSMHKKLIPRGAGIAIFISVALAHAIVHWDYVWSHLYVHIAILLVFVIGFLDDLYDTSPRMKFVVIFIASICLYLDHIYIDYLGTYFGYDIMLPFWLIFPFTFFAIAGFTNALNLIDGLDGLAGGVSLVILSTFLAIGLENNDTLMITLSTSFIVAVSVFLLFNWNPAKIFMGDSGSLTLGFVLATLSIVSLKYIAPASVLFIIAIPLLDTFIVITRRLQRGQSPFKADKNHIHHFLYKIKGNVAFTVVLLLAIQLAFSLIGYQLRDSAGILALVLFSTLFYIFLHFFDQRLRYRKKYHKPKLRLKIKLRLKERYDKLYKKRSKNNELSVSESQLSNQASTVTASISDKGHLQ